MSAHSNVLIFQIRRTIDWRVYYDYSVSNMKLNSGSLITRVFLVGRLNFNSFDYVFFRLNEWDYPIFDLADSIGKYILSSVSIIHFLLVCVSFSPVWVLWVLTSVSTVCSHQCELYCVFLPVWVCSDWCGGCKSLTLFSNPVLPLLLSIVFPFPRYPHFLLTQYRSPFYRNITP